MCTAPGVTTDLQSPNVNPLGVKTVADTLVFSVGTINHELKTIIYIKT